MGCVWLWLVESVVIFGGVFHLGLCAAGEYAVPVDAVKLVIPGWAGFVPLNDLVLTALAGKDGASV
jgi:hypothetical protein